MKKKWDFKHSPFLLRLVLLWGFLFLFFPSKSPEIQSQIPREGDVFPHLLISPVTYDIPKSPEKLNSEKQAARQRVLPVFEYDEKGTASIKKSLRDFKRSLNDFKSLKNLLKDSTETDSIAIYKEKAAKIYGEISKKVSGSAIETLISNPILLTKGSKILDATLDKGISDYLVVNSLDEIEQMRLDYQLKDVPILRTPHNDVTLIKGDEEIRLRKEVLKPLEARLEDELEQIKNKGNLDLRQMGALYEFISAFAAPNLFYLKSETEKRRNEEERLVLTAKGKVFKGMQIIGPGEIVSKESLEKIRALYFEINKEKNTFQKTLPLIGSAIYTLLISIILLLGMNHLHKLATHSRHIYSALFIIPILQVFLFYSNEWIISYAREFLPQYSYNNADLSLLHPFLVGPILSVVLYDFRIAILISLFSSIYYGAFNGFDLYFTSVALLTSLTSIYFLKEIRYRSDLLKGWLVSALIMGIIVMAENLMKPNFTIQQLGTECLLSFINLTISYSMCALMLIPFLERAFKITTNLRLIELSDFNHPALKRISLLTPGTFNHSLMVGNLAEKAAEEIEANPLLVRVMALYHDIGKSLHPEFFTENQKAGPSPHKELPPEESAKIIISHVEDAYALAKEYRIPPTIIAGIPEHHGTGTIHYFYHKAKELYGEGVDISAFQYKGPKPQSKETAVLMLADAIEATTRSLKEPDPENLRTTVNQVINSRLFEGELNESGLNLTDLKRIEIGFLKALEGMYHTRIRYPKGAFLSSPQLQKN